MIRESFIFYKSFYDSIKELDIKYQAEIYNAIFKYQFEGVETELTGVAKSIFTLIIPQLEANNKRYINGCKGGAPKNNQNATKKQPKNNLDLTKKQPNVNDNENENVNENVNENENEKLIECFCNNIHSITPFEYEKLESWLKTFNEDVICKAINIATMNNVRTMKYIDGILKSWKSKGYKSLQDIEIENITKDKPEWFDKDIKGSVATKEEQQEIEDLLSEFS